LKKDQNNSELIFLILIGKIPQSLTQSRKLNEIIRSRVKAGESVVKKGEKKKQGYIHLRSFVL
jgi:hypothetical protein